MFSLESQGFPGAESVSDYDHLKMEEIMENITLKDGNYLVSLLWHEYKLKQIKLNHHVAFKVLDRVVQILENKNLYEEYVKVLEDKEREGIIEPLECTPPPKNTSTPCGLPIDQYLRMRI